MEQVFPDEHWEHRDPEDLGFSRAKLDGITGWLQSQLHIDPLDRFADKLNHGGLLAKVRNGWHRDIENGVRCNQRCSRLV